MSLKPEFWGFDRDSRGELRIAGLVASDLAGRYGTPLHVFDGSRLRARARSIRHAFESHWPGEVRVHYAMKANNVPGIVRILAEEGLRPEAGTPYEYRLARELGWDAGAILVNGPNKQDLLATTIAEGGATLVVDGLEELLRIEGLAASTGRRAPILLRINPDCVPKGMNRASATGSRRGSVFGFDHVSGEIATALHLVARSPHLEYRGLHLHAGTGIRRAGDYRRPVTRLLESAAIARELGLETRILDVGGGFGVATSREFSTREFLLYHALGRLPESTEPHAFPSDSDFAKTLADVLVEGCRSRGLPLPTLVIEPGRSLVSSAGTLLVTVGTVKTRKGVGTWVVADGGAGTVAFPLFYELHEILLARNPGKGPRRPVNLVGSACHAADWLYRNKRMPTLEPGDVLAVCDAGAYFTVQECSFGFYRPAVVVVEEGRPRLIRRRETFEDMVDRDLEWRSEPCAARA